ncbi:hypothetical protein C2857_007210 [Epichloe festucae Fl1]|uniref:Cytochrome b5 heme-binding domain-containing protein n=1 Tax=Epichloe festucae (strain Fl1) TaxID=877507 RepID=A0A7S9PW79_EPIFF|nr:hypothetical protein C2857_007210 [Epichloe festucae Fl1]
MAFTTVQQGGIDITLEDLADHGSLDSLWIGVHGRVYDLTSFISDHPGGIEALESSAGTDGSEAYEYAGHSEENMEKMQQYCIGKLAGSPERTLPPTFGTTNKRMKSAGSGLPQFITPRTRLAVTIIVTSLVVAAFSHRHFPSTPDIFQRQSTATSSQNFRYGFWAGTVIASSVTLVAFVYFYFLFLSSLDYQNDVFSFPPTIPKKTRR